MCFLLRLFLGHRISKVYCLPQWCSPSDYVKYYQAQGLVDIKTDDWTDNIQVRSGDNINSS